MCYPQESSEKCACSYSLQYEADKYPVILLDDCAVFVLEYSSCWVLPSLLISVNVSLETKPLARAVDPVSLSPVFQSA